MHARIQKYIVPCKYRDIREGCDKKSERYYNRKEALCFSCRMFNMNEIGKKRYHEKKHAKLTNV